MEHGRFVYGGVTDRLRLLVVLLPLFFCASALAKPPPLSLDAAQPSQTLRGHIEFIFDASQTLTLEEVEASDDWQVLGEQDYTSGFNQGNVWLRFEVINESAIPIGRIIQVTNGFTDVVTAWIKRPVPPSTRYEAGENTGLDARVIPHFFPRFPIMLSPGQRAQVVLRASDEGTMTLPLKIGSIDYLHQNDATRQWISGLMFGVLGLVAIYALALFVRVRHQLFVWFGVLAIVSLLEWGFCHWGHAGLLFPPDVRGWLANRVIIACFEITAFCLYHFYIEACDLKIYRPRLCRLLQVFAWLGLANGFLVFILPYPIAVKILFAAPAGLAILLFTVLFRAIRGDKVSQRLALAALVMVAGYVFSALTESGVLSRTWLSAYYVPLGTLFQWIFFSDAVAVRASSLDQQRVNALEARIAEEQRSGELREAFGRYVTRDLAEKILDDPEATTLGGRLQNITVLMSDLRGFTSMTHRLGPPAMCALLNDYLGRMTEVIERHGGWVNDFIGDGIFSVFGTPVAQENDALDACRCAIEMQVALAKLNEELKAANRPTLEMGIGIHSGEAVVGNIGSKLRVKWGVIGDPVNICSRIESLTVGSQILLSASVLEKLPDSVRTIDRRAVQVKGRHQMLEVCELRAVEGESLTVPEAAPDQWRQVVQAAHIARLKGKMVSEECIEATVIRVGSSGLVFRSEQDFKGGVDVTIQLVRDDETSEAIYGKVAVQMSPSIAPDETLVHITSIAPSVRSWLDSLVPESVP